MVVFAGGRHSDRQALASLILARCSLFDDLCTNLPIGSGAEHIRFDLDVIVTSTLQSGTLSKENCMITHVDNAHQMVPKQINMRLSELSRFADWLAEPIMIALSQR